MKKIIVPLLVLCVLICSGCGKTNYDLNENTFFLVLTNMQYYPEQYEDSKISLDCFVYELTDVYGKVYTCGVRKCSSGYGCKCGKDTVIGFILDYDGDIPKPINQGEDTADKAWIRISGKLVSSEKTAVEVYAYFEDGSVDKNTVETIYFLRFNVLSLQEIEDYSGLSYYVTK